MSLNPVPPTLPVTPVTVTYNIRAEEVRDFFTTCFEGGCCDWLAWVDSATSLHDPHYLDNKEEGVIWWGQKAYWSLRNWEVNLRPDDDEEKTPLNLFRADFVLSLQAFAVTHGELFAKIFLPDGDYDAGDADTFLQLLLFGEYRYS